MPAPFILIPLVDLHSLSLSTQHFLLVPNLGASPGSAVVNSKAQTRNESAVGARPRANCEGRY